MVVPIPTIHLTWEFVNVARAHPGDVWYFILELPKNTPIEQIPENDLLHISRIFQGVKDRRTVIKCCWSGEIVDPSIRFAERSYAVPIRMKIEEW